MMRHTNIVLEFIKRLKRNVRLMQRMFKDYRSGTAFCARRDIPDLPYKVTLKQPILPSSTLAEKIYNLGYVAERIGDYVIMPGELLSFWNVVGNPDKLKGSRSIRNNKVTIEKGGGLCQAAGIIYHLSLLCGLGIEERYNHSVDLYGDGPRACPIGFDAMVSYGYKDLRIRNITTATLRLTLAVTDDELCAQLHSDVPLAQREVASQIINCSDVISVKTFYQGDMEPIAENLYKVF